MILGWESRRDSQNYIHSVVNNPDGYVSLVGDGPEYGTLPLFFTSMMAAINAHSFLGNQGIYQIVDTDRMALTMHFVRSGPMTLTQDDTRAFWYLDVGYRRVVV